MEDLNTLLIISILLLDLVLGDPVYRLHPIRIVGKTLSVLEQRLFAWGLDGYGGGVLLLLLLVGIFVVPVWIVGQLLEPWPALQFLFHLYWGYHCLALRDLAAHALRIGRAADAGQTEEARRHASMLVGRDTAPMKANDCCRAGLESMGENLVDGVLSPLFWFFVGGIPGMLLFKVVSTMDSMVGYKTPRYLRFGWCGARSDDLMNWIPARLAWLAISAAALMLPGFHGTKAFITAWRQHALVPGPNAGWGETAFAGALGVRLAGPIWKNGILVTDIWIGSAQDATDCTSEQVRKGIVLMLAVTVICALAGCVMSWCTTPLLSIL